MQSPSVLRTLARAAFRASLSLGLLAAPAAALAPSDTRVDLRFGPLVGGQDIRLDLRTTLPLRPFLLFYGLDGTPSVLGPMLPPVGLNVFANPSLFFGVTNAAGRFSAVLPTAPGSIAPQDLGLALFLHAFVVDSFGAKLASNVQATEIEPLPAAPGFLVEEGASRLPAGYDTLGATHVEAVDVNRDGFPDLVLAADLALRIWINDGTGHFADETAARIAWPGDALAALGAADVDRDGDIDLVTGGGYDDFGSVPNRLWINDGTGVFAMDPGFPVGDGLATQFEFADLNGNETLDLLIASGAEGHLAIPGGGISILMNVGGGLFVEDLSIATAPWNDPQFDFTAVRAGDVDGDGDLDVLIGIADTAGVDGTPGQPNLLLLNDATGGFTDVSATQLLPTRSDNTQDLRFADIDGDLDLDIVVANSVLGVSAADSGDVHINQGGAQGGTEGVFHDDPASFLEPNTAGNGIRLSVHPEDIDADGDLDLLVTVHDLFLGADQMLFLNQGGAQNGVEGQFVRQLWFDPPFSGTSGLGDFNVWGAVVFDADHDGDREILLCGAGAVVSPPVDDYTTLFLVNGKL